MTQTPELGRRGEAANVELVEGGELSRRDWRVQPGQPLRHPAEQAVGSGGLVVAAHGVWRGCAGCGRLGAAHACPHPCTGRS